MLDGLAPAARRMSSIRVPSAQVTLTRPRGQTVIQIRPGGTSSEFPINALGIARKIRHVLANAPGIR